MNYINSIKTAILIFPFIALIITMPFILHQYHKYGSINLFRMMIIYSFILYMITIYFLVILPLPNINNMKKPIDNMIHLTPFGFIKDFIKESPLVLTEPRTYFKAITSPSFYTVIFNIIMTIPFGMYLRYYFKCNFKKTIIISFILSLFFEITQLTRLYFIYPYQYRVFDVDDLIMNTLGGTLGYYLMGIIKKLLPTREEIDNQSLKRAKIVSGFRRITIFWLDFFIYSSITILINILATSNIIKYVTFTVYYIIIPYLSNGLTLGSTFLNVKLEYPNFRFIRNGLRFIFIYIYYFYIPYKIIFYTLQIKDYLNLEASKTILLLLINLIIILIFYMKNVFTILKNKTIYYDNLFKVKLKNTLKEGKSDKTTLTYIK